MAAPARPQTARNKFITYQESVQGLDPETTRQIRVKWKNKGKLQKKWIVAAIRRAQDADANLPVARDAKVVAAQAVEDIRGQPVQDIPLLRERIGECLPRCNDYLNALDERDEAWTEVEILERTQGMPQVCIDHANRQARSRDNSRARLVNYIHELEGVRDRAPTGPEDANGDTPVPELWQYDPMGRQAIAAIHQVRQTPGMFELPGDWRPQKQIGRGGQGTSWLWVRTTENGNVENVSRGLLG